MNCQRPRPLLVAAACALVLVLTAACGSSGGSSAGNSGGSGSGGAGKVDNVSLALSTYPTGLHSLPYEVAIKKGFFARNRINVSKLVGTTGGATTIRALVDGGLTFGEIATSSTIQAYNSGIKVAIIGGDVANVNDEYLVAKKGSNYTDIPSLVGKKWAYTHPGSVTDIVSRVALQAKNVDPKEVTLVAAGGISEGLTLVKNGGADVAIALQPSYETLTSTYSTVANLGSVIGPFDQSVKVAGANLVKSNPDLVKRYLLALNEATAWIYKNATEAGAIFAQYSHVAKSTCVAAIKAELSPKHWSLALSVDGMNSVIKGSEQAGLFKPGATDWSQLIDQSLLPSGVAKIDVNELDK